MDRLAGPGGRPADRSPDRPAGRPTDPGWWAVVLAIFVAAGAATVVFVVVVAAIAIVAVTLVVVAVVVVVVVVVVAVVDIVVVVVVSCRLVDILPTTRHLADYKTKTDYILDLILLLSKPIY